MRRWKRKTNRADVSLRRTVGNILREAFGDRRFCEKLRADMGPTLLLSLAKEHRLASGDGPVKMPDAEELASWLLPLKTWEESQQQCSPSGDEISA